MSVIFVHDGTGYTPDGSVGAMTREAADRLNRETSRQEVEQFVSDPPDRYLAYHDGARRAHGGVGERITTWTGDQLGRVVREGRVWTSNMGDRRQSFRMIGANGRVYSGVAYLTAGDYVRLRIVRS